MSIRIILADDHPVVRQGLRALLEKEPDMEVVAEADNGRKAVRLCQELAPDVVIMDVGMPDLNGVEATRQIVARVPETNVIALSIHSERHLVSGMLEVGASGYLLKECAFEDLVQAVRTVAPGQTFLSPSVASVVVQNYVTHTPPRSPLTPREREVLQLLAEGKSTRDIAARLHISPKTVETHRRQIMEKLGRHSIAELTKYAIREGLTPLEN